MFPVRYELNFYINLLRNSVFKGLVGSSCIVSWSPRLRKPTVLTEILHNFPHPDNAVSIATGYGLDSRGVGVRVQVGARNFSSPCRPNLLWSPPSGYRGPFPRVEVDRSTPASAEVKKTWIYTTTPPLFMA
jgi:hypothetical protein